MTGVLNAMAAQPNAQAFSVVLAGTGTGTGFDAPSGSITPASFRGATIEVIQSTFDPSVFNFRLTADVAQSYFRELVVEVTAGGSYKIFRSADATFSTVGTDRTDWTWSASSDGTAGGSVWSGGIGLTRRVLILY